MAKIVIVGSLNMDIIIRTPHIPAVGETIMGRSIHNVPGGKGANQAVACGKLAQGTDISVAMLGRVGADAYGEALIDSLSKSGVDVSGLLSDETEPTGNAYIYVSDAGENNIVVVAGANGKVDAAQIQQFEALFEDCEYCITQFEIPLETVAFLADFCAKKDIRFVVNPAPAQPMDFTKLKSAFLVVPNEGELDMLVAGDASIPEKAQTLLGEGFENVLVTLGGDGCMLVNKEGSKTFPARTDFDAVDTTAAGDSFIGALTTTLCEGKSMEEAIQMATLVAGITVSRKGAQPSLPERTLVMEHLSKK